MKTPIRFSLLIACLCIGFSTVFADGIRMTDDFHFEGGEKYQLTLTKTQIASLEAARVDGELPFPTKLSLTKAQTKALKKSTGKKILEVDVFEGKWSDCSCGAQNIASRFSPDKLELSGYYLVDVADLETYDE